jgi:hypothetical protein
MWEMEFHMLCEFPHALIVANQMPREEKNFWYKRENKLAQFHQSIFPFNSLSGILTRAGHVIGSGSDMEEPIIINMIQHGPISVNQEKNNDIIGASENQLE